MGHVNNFAALFALFLTKRPVLPIGRDIRKKYRKKIYFKAYSSS